LINTTETLASVFGMHSASMRNSNKESSHHLGYVRIKV
jgi:hypothetical protein